jgi:hypothetical protein
MTTESSPVSEDAVTETPTPYTTPNQEPEEDYLPATDGLEQLINGNQHFFQAEGARNNAASSLAKAKRDLEELEYRLTKYADGPNEAARKLARQAALFESKEYIDASQRVLELTSDVAEGERVVAFCRRLWRIAELATELAIAVEKGGQA